MGEFTNSYSGGTPNVNRKEYYGGTIPFIRSAEISGSQTELFLSKQGVNNSSAKLVNAGDILYALYGATSGEVGISQINGAINQAILCIKPDSQNNSSYLEQWLSYQKNKITGKYLQGGQGNLSGSIIKKIIVSKPSYNEQKLISRLFITLGKLIAANPRQLKITNSATINRLF